MNDCLLCDRTGWTMDYVQDMDPILKEKARLTFDAVDRARAFLRKQNGN